MVAQNCYRVGFFVCAQWTLTYFPLVFTWLIWEVRTSPRGGHHTDPALTPSSLSQRRGRRKAAHTLQPPEDACLSVAQCSVTQTVLSFTVFSSVLQWAYLALSLGFKISRISRQHLSTTLCHFCSSSKKYTHINQFYQKITYWVELCIKMVV